MFEFASNISSLPGSISSSSSSPSSSSGSDPLVLDTSVDDSEDEEIDDDEDENNFEDSGICDQTETSMTDIDSSIDNNQSLNSSGITA